MSSNGLYFPDYSGANIINLMGSIAPAMGVEDWPIAGLDGLPAQRLHQARNVVLLVVDGLGLGYLREHGGGGHLLRHLHGGLSSVAPATTAAAIPSYLTGLPPARHGFTGWFTWLRELGCVSAVLPYVTRHGGLDLASAGISPLALSDTLPLSERMRVATHVVSPRHIAHSAFNRAFSGGARIHPYQGMSGLFEQLAALATRRGLKRKYIYAYWPELDSLAHRFGIASTQARAHLAEFDRAFGAFLERIAGSGTAVLVIADHGFLDCPPARQIQLDDHPQLRECLTLPLCGEPRFAYCYVDPRRVTQFERYVTDELAPQAELLPADDLLRRGLFGPGERHPRLAERIGHYALAMRENWVIKEWLPGDRRYRHIGFHGGLSEVELQVPLVYAEA